MLFYKIKTIEENTKDNNGFRLVLKLSLLLMRYLKSKKIIYEVAAGKIDNEKMNESLFFDYLEGHYNILVRTSEECISNFLLWQCDYSFFEDVY